MKKILFCLLIVCFSLIFISNIIIRADEDNNDNSYAELSELLQYYYNNGEYNKKTNIFADIDAISQDVNELGQEASNFFHANHIPTLERSTYYHKDALWMENGKNYSYYGSQNGYLTSGRTDVKYEVPSSLTNAVSSSGMEEYYVTLKDFIDGTTGDKCNYGNLVLFEGWTYNQQTGVYENYEEDVLDAFRLFTAPLWLGKTKENKNYISYSKATIEVIDKSLVMKLWVYRINSGIVTSEIIGDYMVFSQAVIFNPNVMGDYELGENELPLIPFLN